MLTLARTALSLGALSLLGVLFLGNHAAARLEPAKVSTIPSYSFVTPIFGLAVAPDDSFLVADAGAGVVELRGEGNLIAELPGVTDIAPIGRGDMFAITGAGDGENARKLFRVSRGGTREIADLATFEAEVNPDGAAID